VHQVWRPKVHPRTLTVAGGKGFDHAAAQAANPALRSDFPSHWREGDVRGCVRAACGGACAYCGDLVGRTGEDVEHFRPKAVYWFLAYVYENYLASCRQCNSSRKGSKFDLDAAAVAATDLQAVKTEKRLLLDPVLDRVEKAMTVVMVDNRYLWDVNPTASPLLRKRAAHTIQFFALNDDGELVKARSTAVATYLSLTVEGSAAMKQAARRSASRYRAHGGAIRSVVVAQNAPQLLPSPAEELQWLIEDLVEVLQAFRAAARPNTGNRDLVRYALAALAVAPPGGVSKTTVRQQITAGGVWPDVENLRALVR
jgi:uncharacterized protein (TIGR02646 family)